jgi:hypothetical protein
VCCVYAIVRGMSRRCTPWIVVSSPRWNPFKVLSLAYWAAWPPAARSLSLNVASTLSTRSVQASASRQKVQLGVPGALTGKCTVRVPPSVL